MKKLIAATILLDLGLLAGGCGNNQPDMQGQNQQTQQTQVQQDGISLVKAINLAKNNQFTPQRVQFEAYTTNRVFGDEPEITVTSVYENGEAHKFVKIVITDPEVIKKVAKLQDNRQNKYVTEYHTVTLNEITFDNFNICAKEVEAK